jgi:pSer/pThr/pTyr-binding forkhead associated (FHA) protein
MSVAILTVLKLVLLALLYYFVYRVVRAILTELYGPSRRRAPSPPRPAVAADPAPKRPRRAPRELVVHPPDGKPTVVALDREGITLGRSQRMAVQIDDVYVSDEHALVAPGENGWIVRDLGSTNGTYLNGAKVTQPTPIGAGDQVRIGKTRIEVRR